LQWLFRVAVTAQILLHHLSSLTAHYCPTPPAHMSYCHTMCRWPYSVYTAPVMPAGAKSPALWTVG
jgi:hypothetical protein